jgi:hypothetical protein
MDVIHHKKSPAPEAGFFLPVNQFVQDFRI